VLPIAMVARAVTVAIRITIAVGIIAVVRVAPVPAPPGTPAPTPPPWEAEVTNKDDVVIMMMEMIAPIAAMPVAHSGTTSHTHSGATTEGMSAATATMRGGCDNWSSEHGRKKVTQEKHKF